MAKLTRNQRESLALSRRNDRFDANRKREADRQAKVVARRAAIAQYDVALMLWHDANCVGPAPLDPRYYNMALFPENANGR